jgi:hypothetical protein
MQYNISILKDIACITIEGNLNALDLLFMLRSKKYKDVIKQYKKIIIDYTNISGSEITEQDGFAISMLGKMDWENLGKITIVMAVYKNKRDFMEKITNSIFSDSQIDVLVTDSKNAALKILHST